MNFKKRHLSVITTRQCSERKEIPFVVVKGGKKGAVWGAQNESSHCFKQAWGSKQPVNQDRHVAPVKGLARVGGYRRVLRIATRVASSSAITTIKYPLTNKKWRGSGEGSSSHA